MTSIPGRRSRELEDAFHVFSEVSERLTESYRVLENRVAVLTEELAAARSERLQQLAEKERLAQRLQQLLEALPGGVVVLDGAGRVQECNPGAHELLGAPLLGERWTDVAQRAFRGADSGSTLTLHDGRPLSVATQHLSAEPGRILLLKDVSETRALEAMVARHQRLSAMGEMLARLAHQIRTPLASAMLYLGHLQLPVCEHEDRARAAGKVLARLRQLERMVNDMLVFARGGERGAESVSMGALLDEFSQTLQPQLQLSGGRLHVLNTAPESTVLGSREALLGVLLNLATNAMQAAVTAVSITVEVGAAADGALEIQVSDNGPGIIADIRERIFEPFFTTRNAGTGLGLAVVRAVVEAHRGTIRVHTRPGCGATFVVSLPVSQCDDAMLSGVGYLTDRGQRLDFSSATEN